VSLTQKQTSQSLKIVITYNYRLELMLQDTWHVKRKIWSKCHQAVESKYNEPKSHWKQTK